MNQERIVLLDPRATLGSCREALARPGAPVEAFSRLEELLAASPSPPAEARSTVVLLDGDQESGLDPGLAARLSDLAPELPPLVLAVVADRARGRAWTRAGAAGFIERPVDPEELRIEVDRWLHHSERIRRLARRVEALRRFFAMFAHDLQNPITSITGYCEMASAHPFLPPEAREDLEKARRNIDLLTTMAEGFLEMVRGSSSTRLGIRPREVELKSVVNAAVEMMRVRAGARGTVIRVRADGPPTLIRADPARIIEAMANVIDNAIKYSPERSTVEVSVSSDREDALVTVDDQGPGIPVADRELVFERFGQVPVPHEHSGLGLGLSIARDIVELHHGAIWVEGLAPRGTRVALRLPRAGPPGAAAPSPTAPAHAPRSREKESQA